MHLLSPTRLLFILGVATFLLAVVDRIAARGLTDARSVYVLGHSNGGMMALRLLCERAERVAGAVVVAGNLPRDAGCAPARAVPILLIHGGADPIVPPVGGPLGRRGARGHLLSASATATILAEGMGCLGRAARVVDAVADDGTRLLIDDYQHCRAPLRHIVIDGGGHGWPGGAPRAERIFGVATREIDAGVAAVDFWFSPPAPTPATPATPATPPTTKPPD